MFGSFLRATPLARDPPQELREVFWDGRQSKEFLEIIPLGWMCGCAQEAASGPLQACLSLLWDSEGVITRRGIRSAPEDHVGSYSSDLVSNRRYAHYPGGGGGVKALICVVIGRDGGRSVGQ